MLITWIFWSGIVLTLAGALPAGYAWYGKILGIVEKEKAKKIWLSGIILMVLGIMLVFGSVASGSFPEGTPKQEAITKTWLPYFWLAIGIMVIGALPMTLLAQSHVLDMVSSKTAQRAFKIAYVLLGIGAVILFWVMMPGHMLP